MKTINPSILEIQDYYFNFGLCTITLRDDKTIRGNFRPGRVAESGKITGWKFREVNTDVDITIQHDDIREIDNDK